MISMGIQISPSDLYYKYRRNKELPDEPKFTGKPDSNPYDRDDLYDVIPMLSAVLDELRCRDANVLHLLGGLFLYRIASWLYSANLDYGTLLFRRCVCSNLVKKQLSSVRIAYV